MKLKSLLRPKNLVKIKKPNEEAGDGFATILFPPDQKIKHT
jgi:hypothetical protein